MHPRVGEPVRERCRDSYQTHLVAMGGGGDSCALSTCDWSDASFEAFDYGAGGLMTYHTYHGEIQIDPASDPTRLVVRVTNPGMQNRVTITVTHSHPDSVHTVIDPEYTP